MNVSPANGNSKRGSQFVQFLAIVLLALAIGLAIVLSYVLVDAILPTASNSTRLIVKALAGSFGTVTVLAYAREAWSSFTTIWQMIDWSEFKRVFTECGKVFLATVGLAVAIFSFEDVASSKAASLSVNSFVIAAGRDSAVTLEDRILLPFFNKEVTDGTQGCDKQAEVLATVDEAALSSINAVACGLRRCSTDRRPVKVDVQGFASSRDFVCPGRDSDDLNLELSELRRTAITKLLMNPLETSTTCPDPQSAGNLVIEPSENENRWREFDDMASEREFQDRESGEAQRAREVLTRRVDIVVLDAGDCARDDPRGMS